MIKMRHTFLVSFYLACLMREKVQNMELKIVKAKSLSEYLTSERCFIAENYSSSGISVASAE